MAIYRLARGLEVRSDGKTMTFYRDLDNENVQFEDVETGRVLTLSKVDVFKQIQRGTMVVIGSSDIRSAPSKSQGSAGKGGIVIDNLSENQLKDVDRKISYVRELKKRAITRGSRSAVAKCLPAIADKLQDELPPSVSTLLRWMKTFEASGNNPGSLLSGNSIRNSSCPSADSRQYAWEFLLKNYFVFRGQFLTRVYELYRNRLRSGDGCSGNQAKSPNDTPLSYATFRRLAMTVSGYERDRIRLGPSTASAKWRHSTGGVYATRPLERVEMDHTLLDLYVIDDARGVALGRPTVTILVDSYSRYVLSAYVAFEGETLGRLSRCIKLALSPKDELTEAAGTTNAWITPGLWETLVVDNGLAFQSPQLRHMAYALGCEIEYSPVRKPWFKPSVERTIGELTRILPSAGKPNKPGEQVDRENPDKHACVMFSDLCLAITKWAVDVHPFAVNHRSLQRPFDRLMEGMQRMPAPSFVTNLDELDIVTGLSKEATVAHSGIEMNYLSYRSYALGQMARQQQNPRFKTMLKYDPNDLGHVWVQDPIEKSWLKVECIHQDYAKGLTRYQHSLIRKACKEKLRSSNAHGQFLKAQGELKSMLDEAMKSGRRLKKDMRKMAIMSNMTSLQPTVLALKAPNAVMDLIPLYTDSDLCDEDGEIPMFEAYDVSAEMEIFK